MLITMEKRLPRNAARWIVLGTVVELHLSPDRYGPIWRHEILKLSSLPPTTIDDHLRTLVSRGILVSWYDGRYELRQDGKDQAASESVSAPKKLRRAGNPADKKKWLPLRKTSVELESRSLPRYATRRMILGALVELSMTDEGFRPVSRRELLEVLPLSATNVGERLSLLHDEGRGVLTRPGRGMYELMRWTEKKPAQLKDEEEQRLKLEKIQLMSGG